MIMPEVTLGNVFACAVALWGAYMLQWGARKGMNDDAAVGIILIVLAWGVTKIGPLI
jgi:hypothetical protein